MDIKQTLQNHKIWLDTGGQEGERAELLGANLSESNLSGANLYMVNLSESNLYMANLIGADLSGAKLIGANLSGANLSESNLYRTNLRGANLSEAKLRGANLSEAKLCESNLYKTDISGAKLRGANLSEAKGILQWQSPLGEKLICYSVLHGENVMHQIGCHWGNTKDTIAAIRKKYGDNSVYEGFVWLADDSLMIERKSAKGK